MAGYEIGISGIRTAQRALDIIGNNVANASTSGYHRQDIDLRPADESFSGGFTVGQGVEFNGIIRRINTLVEEQILNQDANKSSLWRQMESLSGIQSALAELSTPGISTALDNFYNAFEDLSVRPEDISLQSAVISAAQTLTNQFRNVDSVATNLYDTTYTEAMTIVESVNELTSQIADMNNLIYSQSVRGFDASNTMDQRDGLIIKLNQLAGVDIIQKQYGQVDVVMSGIPLVSGSQATEIEARLVENNGDFDLAVSIVGTEQTQTEIAGGSLGGLFTLRNSTLRDILSKLDTLAQTIITETNQLHVQGVGAAGSFNSLVSWSMASENVSEFDPPISDGTIYVRLTAPDGTSTRYEVDVTSASTMTSVAADFAAIPGLTDNTGLHNGRLQIVANSGYTFDFLPGVLSSPLSTNPDPLPGTADGAAPEIHISGLYSGTTNQEYTCAVSTVPPGSSYAVGTGTMELIVEDEAGNTVASVNIGQGYEAGTEIALENGVKITLSSNGTSPGYLTDSEEFVISALANSDTSGFLAAVGINCFFSGADASSMSVATEIADSGLRIAVSRSVEQSDNANAATIAQLGQTASASLGNISTREYYLNLATEVGNDVSFAQMQYDNSDGILKNLEDQRNEVSGVDINDQAMMMMVYERLFQAMSKYMNTINDTLQEMINILS